MKEEKQSLIEVILIIIVALLISYSFYLLAGYYAKRVDVLERDVMKIQEEMLQIKAKIYAPQNE
jgi:ABC-type dipeptide/oligopeptide/nickel transport system permease subunit